MSEAKAEETATPKFSGWRVPYPHEVLSVMILIAAGLLASQSFISGSIGFKICTAISAVAGLAGIQVGVAFQPPRVKTILAKEDIRTAEALGDAPPAKAVAIVAASTGKPTPPPLLPLDPLEGQESDQ